MKRDSASVALLYLIAPAFSHDFAILYILLGVAMVATALIGFCLHGTSDRDGFSSLTQLEDNSAATTFMYSRLATASIVMRSFGATNLHMALIALLPKLFVYQFAINAGWLFIGKIVELLFSIVMWFRIIS